MADAVAVKDALGTDFVLAVGVDATLTFTLNLNGSLSTDTLTGAAITGRLINPRTRAEVLAAKALTNINNGAKTADLVLTDVETALFPTDSLIQGDLKVVLADTTERNHGPYEFRTREAITP